MVSRSYAAVFTIFTVACVVFSSAAAEPTRGVSLTLLYPAISFAVMAVAYAGLGARLLGKRPDGRRHLWAAVLLAPYLLLTRLSFAACRLISRQPAVCEVSANVLLGRRLGPREARLVQGAAVLDLAAEFSEAEPYRIRQRYRSLPLLDATAPTSAELRNAVEWVVGALETGPVFVHCALGHGRSACVVIACLLRLERAKTVREGLALLRRDRPRVGLTVGQRRVLREWEEGGKHGAVT